MEQTLRDRPVDRLVDRRVDLTWSVRIASWPASQDTMIDKVGPDLNYGACPKPWLMNMRTGSPPSDEHYRILLAFKVSGIKATCQIDSAELKVVAADDSVTQPVPIAAYQLTQTWDEGSSSNDCQPPPTEGAVSWNNCTTTQAWTAPNGGGTFLPTALDTKTFTAGANSITFDVKLAVEAWIKGATNAGILLDEPGFLSSGNNWIAIYAQEAGSSNAAQLTVRYRCPPGD